MYADMTIPAFDSMQMPGFASYARMELAIGLARNGVALEESSALMKQAMTISVRRRTGELLGMVSRWEAATGSYRATPVVRETTSQVRAWRLGQLDAV